MSLVVHDSGSVVESLLHCRISFTESNLKGLTFAERKTRSRPEVLFRRSVAKGRVARALLATTGVGRGVRVYRCVAVMSLVSGSGAIYKVVTVSQGSRTFPICSRCIILTYNKVNKLFGGSAGFSRVTKSNIKVTVGRRIRVRGLSCVRVRPAALCSGGPKQHFLISRSIEKRNTLLCSGGKRHFAGRLRPESLLDRGVFTRVRGSKARFM